MKPTSLKLIAIAVLVVLVAGCDDFLNRNPLSDVTPAEYLWHEADLAAYTINRYNFPSHGGWGVGTFASDNHTDNQATSGYATRWVPGEWRVPSSGGAWAFGNIYQLNYFLDTVLPRYESGELSGNQDNIEHYIGEAYFLRAYEYFNRVQELGDFPIVTAPLPDEMDALVQASERRPRNEVGRFILEDLDRAIELLSSNPPGGTNRISRYAALLFKSRVALHEGTWLKYHAGTAHVPGGPGWPGGSYSVDIDAESRFFLQQATEAASEVADLISLVESTHDDGYDSSDNPYFTMFGDENLSSYSEVLLWRDYNLGEGIYHNVNHYINQNGGNTGYTREFVDTFVMANGLPIYAPGSGYAGDDYISDVKVGRDNRLQLFMKAPGELRLTNATTPDGEPILEGEPDIVGLAETRYVTGYAVKKGLNYEMRDDGSSDTIGAIIFRAVEAYLNYIEASYLLNGSIDGKADQYWRAIRERAGIQPDYMVTVNATNMQLEAKNDFGAYSAGQILNDPILYNIRRERRSELMAEGLRYFDLKRWRALDQLIDQPHIIEGFKLWGPMQEWYEGDLIRPEDPGTPNVSSDQDSEYLQVYRRNLDSGNFVRDGYRWAKAHYLSPIAIQHFSITTEGESSDLESSVIYQNPYWPLQGNAGAIE